MTESNARRSSLSLRKQELERIRKANEAWASRKYKPYKPSRKHIWMHGPSPTTREKMKRDE